MGRTSFSVGVVTGLAIIAGALTTAGRVASTTPPGADVRVLTGPTGELDVTPAGAALVAPDLRPGQTATGTVTVRNQTAAPVRLRVSESAPEVVVELPGADAALLGSGQARTFALTARLSDGDQAGATVATPLSITAVAASG